MDIEGTIRTYLLALDNHLTALSHMKEGRLTHLPTWTMSHRRVSIIIGKASGIIQLRITPVRDLDKDVFQTIELEPGIEEYKFEDGWFVGIPNRFPMRGSGGIQLMNFAMYEGTPEEQDKYNARPAAFDPSLYTSTSVSSLAKDFSVEKAEGEALNLWGVVETGGSFSADRSFVDQLEGIFDKYLCLIKNKSFKERKIHRFINEHRAFFLPDHKECYFEHPLFLKGEKQVADFILQRDEGMPALLIELETPANDLFKKNGEPTAEANHAKNQIARWVQYIDQNQDNIEGAMDFLAGPKQRLVVMGRGMEWIEEMIESRNSDTLMWTYHMLHKQAKERWNRKIAEACKLMGIKTPNLLR